MPDLQEPSRVLIGGMQTDAGLAAIQQLVREGEGLLSNSRSVALCRRCSIDNISCSLVYIYLGSWAHPLEYKSQAAYVSDGESESAERIISMEISRRDISRATAFVCARPPPLLRRKWIRESTPGCVCYPASFMWRLGTWCEYAD